MVGTSLHAVTPCHAQATIQAVYQSVLEISSFTDRVGDDAGKGDLKSILEAFSEAGFQEGLHEEWALHYKSGMSVFFNTAAGEVKITKKGEQQHTSFSSTAQTYKDHHQKQLYEMDTVRMKGIATSRKLMGMDEWILIPGRDTMILGFSCLYAESKRRTADGPVHKAWYAPDIPVSDGPAGYGGLPGLIIDLVVVTTGMPIRFSCTRVVLNAEMDEICLPSISQVIPAEQYRKQYQSSFDKK